MSSDAPPFPPLVWIVGFAGHRPDVSVPGRSEADLNALKSNLEEALTVFEERAAKRRGRIEFATSVAAGADIIAAEIAVRRKIPLHLFLPLAEEDFARDFEETPEWWARAKTLIEQARVGENGSTLRIADGARTRPDCYYDAGSQIVEAADAMLVVWDGKPAAGLGGTSDIVERARAEKLPIIRKEGAKETLGWKPITLGIVPPWGVLKWENLDSFASEDDAGLVWSDALRSSVAKHLRGRVEATDGVIRVFQALDHAAIDAARETWWTAVLVIFLHGGASLLAAGGAVFLANTVVKLGVVDLKLAFTLVELVCVAFATAILWRLHLRKTPDLWLRLRPAAELVRALQAAGRLLDPLFPLIARHVPAWRRFSMSIALAILREEPAKSLEEAKRFYLSNRIGDQLAHYRKMLGRGEWKHQLAHGTARWCSVGALFFVSLAVLSKVPGLGRPTDLWLGIWHDFATLFLPIALPLIAGTATAWQTALDAGRRSRTYSEMVERLNSLHEAMATIKTEAALRRFVYQVEEVLIDEQVEWRTATSVSQH